MLLVTHDFIGCVYRNIFLSVPCMLGQCWNRQVSGSYDFVVADDVRSVGYHGNVEIGGGSVWLRHPTEKEIVGVQ
jgi:hypothetical protein